MLEIKKAYLQEAKELLRRKGYRVTGPRLAILGYLAEIKGHLNAQEIYGGIRSEHPGIGMATVYRTLDLLANVGLLRILALKNNQARYELVRPGDHHHHLVCKTCGDITEFGSCNFQLISGEIEAATRFKIDEHTLEVYGCCPACITGSRGYSTEKM